MSNKIPETWWNSEGGFFGKLYLEGDDSFEGFLDRPQDLGERVEEEVTGVIKLCNLEKGDSVLDCPSGYGRHSIALATKGLSVVGIDINDFFLKVAKEKSKELKLSNCHFNKKDMRDITYNNEFDAVINMFYSFGFFDSDEENLTVLKNFCRALKPGGKFLMHTHIFSPRVLGTAYEKHEVRTLKSGNKLELFRGYNPKTRREDGQWFILREDGSKEASAPYSMRIYDKEEFNDFCLEAGFSRTDAYGGWNGEKFADDSPQLIMVATK